MGWILPQSTEYTGEVNLKKQTIFIQANDFSASTYGDIYKAPSQFSLSD